MFDYDENEEIKSKFKARIKQILTTTTLPSYGNLRLKQFAKITKKAYNKKSTLLSSDENQLSNLELRLDVVVLRLNLAPNIL
jgi:ribosomal protein S4